MKILILGIEGYIGTALSQYLRDKGHTIEGVDNDLRTTNVKAVGSASLIPKYPVAAHMPVHKFDISKNYEKLRDLFKEFQPNAIVHLAEQPSAAFSMKPGNGWETQRNNVGGTMNVLEAMNDVCPDAHLIKLGTEGEYPDCFWDGKHIPEGSRMVVGHYGPDGVTPWEIPTPRYAGSWYHFSKLHDSMNIDYACKIWGLRATDVNQGIVYGHEYNTRFDYDECFGTVLNRFIVQAVSGTPLTVYGKGGQTRGFIALKNSIEAIELLAENPPEKGEFRVIHQTTESKSVKEVAELVLKHTSGNQIQYIENPRVEMESNHFTFDNSTLMNLGLKPVTMEEVIPGLIEKVQQYRVNFLEKNTLPQTKWNK